MHKCIVYMHICSGQMPKCSFFYSSGSTQDKKNWAPGIFSLSHSEHFLGVKFFAKQG